MIEHLKRLLTPADDGRAFTEAVLFKASGALHRRRQLAEAQAPAVEWLARWARPWVVATLFVLAMIAFVPFRPWGAAHAAASPAPADSEVMSAALMPSDIAAASATEVLPER
jgi:hypothetical protein